jgi:hypothetical protein
MENEFTLITIFILALSFYINLCYKKNQYRKFVLNNLIYKKPSQINPYSLKNEILKESNISFETEKSNQKYLKIILPLNVLFIGYCSSFMNFKFFIVFLFLVSVYMVTFILDKRLNVGFREELGNINK